MHLTLMLAIFLLLTTPLPLLATSNSGFSTELIHRDSPTSPFFNPNLTSFERLLESISRSIARYYILSTQDIDSPITSADGEYLMSLKIGTPPLEVLAIADTSSDLTWTQCKPCACYKQTAPIFDSSKSSTYSPLPCHTQTCSLLPSSSCDRSKCSYLYQYADGYHTGGVLSSETVSIGSESVPKFTFGCSHNNGGTFQASSGGIVGLGGGSLSLVSQLGETTGYKFSYCLVPSRSKATSKINFGNNADIGGNALVTPLVRGRLDTFYTVRLESISVASGRKIAASLEDNIADEGNIIVDSSTTLTILDDHVLSSVVRDVNKVVRYRKTRDARNIFSLCYDVSGENMNQLDLPDLTFHFTGAAVTLKPMNTFIQTAETVVCLAMASASTMGGGIQILGSIAQQNFHVGYDLKKRTVSFAPANCSTM